MDAIDFMLVNALEISPRASWASLESVLDADATTLARRWKRLVDLGLTWSGCYFATTTAAGVVLTGTLAFVEVDCVAGERESVIESISRAPHVISIECTSGSRELILTLGSMSVAEVDRYVSTELAVVPGVRATRTHFTRRFFKEGGDWRLDVLPDRKLRMLQRLETQAGAGVEIPDAPSPLHRRVIEALASDARRSASSVATEIGRSVATTARAITQVTHADWAMSRIDFAHSRVGFGASTLLWFSVPHLQVEAVGVGLGLMKEVRMCCSVIGRSNLVASLWMRDLGEFESIERRIATVFPSARLDDRWMIMRTPKRVGHLLDADHRHSGFVPFVQTQR